MKARLCVIVPTYNNHKTVVNVVERIKLLGYPVIVVNDGSIDDTAQLLSAVNGITVCSYTPNRGKGHALRAGFQKAIELGYDYAATIDSDGQHYPEDLPKLISALDDALQNDRSGKGKILIVGNRKLQQDNMPGGNTFANYFSNFWFMVQTWQYLPDTQTGMRIYPLHYLYGLRLLTARYEAELELLVLSAWHGVKLISTPIRVFYPDPSERVSHFRPLRDFGRISVLNTILCILCFVYGYWAILFNKLLGRC